MLRIVAAGSSGLKPLLVALALAAFPGSQGLAQPSGSGLPLPRFASLAGDRINVRTGPGKQYPIRWIYARTGLPVKIVQEFDTWRKIEDQDGDQGWVHVSLLSGRRTVLVQGSVQELMRTPDTSARILARAEPGVVARLVTCESSWCELEVQGYRGWMGRERLWGVLEGDTGF
jgi:SH3-like domain-containing protein